MAVAIRKNGLLGVEHPLLPRLFYVPQGGCPMIMTQEQAFLKAQQQLQTLIDFVGRASAEQQRLDQVERGLLSHLLELALSLLTAFVAAAGDGNGADTATAPVCRMQHPLPQPPSP